MIKRTICIETDSPRKASLEAKPSFCKSDYIINHTTFIENDLPRKASLEVKPSLCITYHDITTNFTSNIYRKYFPYYIRTVMKLNIEPLIADTYYHIYNRGTNSENIFKEERNYDYFLKKYAFYIHPVAETYAYCLLKNHFHLLIRTRSEQVILATRNKDAYGNTSDDGNASTIVSGAFASFFKSYAQSINKSQHRTGRLFEEPFRRIEVDTDEYLLQIIKYIHRNPQTH